MIIFANLDCEARWGGGQLPQHVARRVSAAASLLAAFAPEGEPVEIYAPAAVDAARIQLPNVTMKIGAPARWDLAWADPNAKAANDRRLALSINEQLGTQLPGACVIESLGALDAHLAAIRAERWVCKAPWTAAGRDRAHGEGSTLAGEQRVYVGRLIERFGAVLFEPWCERAVDVGVCAELASDGTLTTETPHTLLSDPRGGFLGIDLTQPDLADDHLALLARAVEAVGRALHDLGYAGPLTVDAFVYRDGAAQRLHPLCEVNARRTFGHVARALQARLGALCVLGFGAPPDGARTLIAPTPDDPITAWAI